MCREKIIYNTLEDRKLPQLILAVLKEQVLNTIYDNFQDSICLDKLLTNFLNMQGVIFMEGFEVSGKPFNET